MSFLVRVTADRQVLCCRGVQILEYCRIESNSERSNNSVCELNVYYSIFKIVCLVWPAWRHMSHVPWSTSCLMPLEQAPHFVIFGAKGALSAPRMGCRSWHSCIICVCKHFDLPYSMHSSTSARYRDRTQRARTPQLAEWRRVGWDHLCRSKVLPGRQERSKL